MRTDYLFEIFKENGNENLTFIAVNLTEGSDLPDDLCRCIYMPRVMTHIISSDEQYIDYMYLCMKDTIQAFRRGVRHENDY